MAKVYADLIRKGLKTVDEVPSALQEEVRQIIVMS
ncbi:CD1375 family protein [Paenibacillus zanthoxyli]|nr:CD1375 family protein [Paenibacillus zanthoxyli]